MLNEISQLLDQHELDLIHRHIAKASWQSGTLTAGEQARKTKLNEELVQDEHNWMPINKLVASKLYVHPHFQSLVLPSKLSATFVTRCLHGMHYGQHIDNPIMGSQHARYRSDLAITVFLTDPDSYDGGELSIESRYGPVAVKLPAGSAVIYPATSLHEVTPVTAGERIVCVLWAQSMIKDAHQRELLHDLNEARQALIQSTPEAMVTKRIEHVYANLLRLWADV